MSANAPSYIYRLALGDDVITKGMVQLFHDFGIDLTDDMALKLFYSILAHLMYHLDSHPGQYFKLKFLDIVSDKDNFICVKRNSEYTADTVDPQMFYKRFCSTAVLKEELKHSFDLFTDAILGVMKDKRRERDSLNNLLKRRKFLSENIQKGQRTVKRMNEQKKRVLQLRKEEYKQIRKYRKRQIRRFYTMPYGLMHRKKFKQAYTDLEAKLSELWDSKLTLKEMLDKTL